MTRWFAALFCLALSLPASAAVDPLCNQDCLTRGGGKSYCARTCVMPEGGLLNQPGLPKNPAFEQLEREADPRKHEPGGLLDQKCFKDCQRRGYALPLCTKQCSY